MNVEHIHDLDEIHGVQHELAGIHELDLPALALQACMQPDQLADAARVHHRNVRHVQDKVGLALVDGRNHCVTETIDRVTQTQRALEANDLHPTLFSCADVHGNVLIAISGRLRYTPQTLRENLAGCNCFSSPQEL